MNIYFYLQIQAELKNGSSNSNVDETEMTELWKLIGIDIKNTPDHLTFKELGINSLFIAEFEQNMLRNHGIKMNQNQIKNISVGILKEIDIGYLDNLKILIEQNNIK